MKLYVLALPALVSVTVLSVAVVEPPQVDALRKALTFHVSFDGGTEALRAAGDPKLYWTPTFKQRDQAKPGLPDTGEVLLAKGEFQGLEPGQP